MLQSSLNLFVLLLFSLLPIIVHSQHTTSPRFTPQPTSSGVVCIQMVCPSPDSVQPTCPTDCPSGCKLIPDQCCPQLTVAVCQDSNSSSVSSASSPASTSLEPTVTPTHSPSSSPPLSSSSVGPTSSPSPNSNLGLVLQPSLTCLLGLVILTIVF